MKIDQFTKSASPITVIVNITNPVALKLAHILIEQGSKILIVDKLSFARKKMLTDLLQNPNCLFMDSESTFKNISKFKKIDYVYYFLSQLTVGSTYPSLLAENMEVNQLSHKDFIRESNRIDAYLKLALEFRASATLVTSAYVGQFLEKIPELNIQIQKYAESLLLDYVKKNKLDARIVRLGELIGEGGDPASPTNLSRLLRELILREKINIFGDGLQQNYLVHTEDAVYALLKATFTKKTSGETYLAAYSHPFTSLSLAYQLLELTSEEKEVVFNEVLPDYEEILKLNEMCISKSVASIGWEPQIPLEQGLSESLEELSEAINFPWKSINKTLSVSVSEEVGSTSNSSATIERVDNSRNKAVKSVVTSGVHGKLYSFNHRFIAEPIMWFMNIPKRLEMKFSKDGEKIKNTSRNTFFSLLIIVLSVWITYPYVDIFITGLKARSLAKSFVTDISSLNTENFDLYSEKFPKYADSILKDYQTIGYWQYLPFAKDTYTEIGEMLQGYSLYAQSASSALKASAPALEIVQGIASVTPNAPAGQQSRSYYNEIEEIMDYRSDIVQATQQAQVAQLRLNRVDSENLPDMISVPFESSKELLDSFTISLAELEKFYDLIPYLLGYKDRTNYFLMMQNETELRATGGWFTNYAILGIENGQVREFTVEDIYNTEGQIEGLSAPLDMKTALDVDTYKLGLSNWDPELKNVSEDIEILMGQSGKYKPNDITITVNFSVIAKLLSVVGPIEAGSLGEITRQNMFDKIGQLHSEFTPGSQEKVSVTSEFMPNLLESIAKAPIDQKQDIISVLLDSVADRDIMIYSSDPLFRTKVLDKYDTYRTINPEDNPLFTVDWNWGGNKANRYVTKVTDLVIDEINYSVELTTDYTNESTTADYPQGIYQNIQRTYYPTQFKLNSYEGYVGSVSVFETKYKNIPYTLGKVEVGLRSKQDTKLVFDIKEMPDQLFLPKQSGINTEVIHVAILQLNTSSISDQKLREQGFTSIDNKWTKTYIRTEDVAIKLK